MDDRNTNTGSGSTATQHNPHFKNIERAPYELGYLLLDLPRHPSQAQREDNEVANQAAAAIQHAENAQDSLLRGLEALGACMFFASTSEDYALGKREFGNLGTLISHIAAELQFLCEVTVDYREVAEGGAQ